MNDNDNYPYGMYPYGQYNSGCGTIMMFIVVLLAAVFTLSACRTSKKVASSNTDARKTDSVVIRTEYREVFDTTYITIERQSESVIVRDTVSMLENEYAKSRAEIRGDGLLFHSLETKPHNKPVPVKTVEIVRDSIVYRDRYIKEEKDSETVIEKIPFYRRSEFLFLVLVAIMAAIYALRKYFLKFIIYIMKK